MFDGNHQLPPSGDGEAQGRIEMNYKLREALVARINNYFQMGGVFNPEQMDHIKVRDLLKDCREFLAAPSEPTDKRLSREEKLEQALRGIMEIGKRDMSNPKYDGYFDTAREALAAPSEPQADTRITCPHEWGQTYCPKCGPGAKPQASEPPDEVA